MKIGNRWIPIGDLLNHKADDATVSEIVFQLLICNFECEGGPLHNNVAFRSLIRMAWEEGCPRWGRKPAGTIGPCGECGHCKMFGDL